MELRDESKMENGSKLAMGGAGSVVVSIFAVVNVIIGATVRWILSNLYLIDLEIKIFVT